MSNVYSHRFLLAAAGSQASYVVPDGYTAVVRCITAMNRDASNVQSAGVRFGTPALWIWADYLPADPGGSTTPSVVVDLRVVVNPGETIQTANGTLVDMTVSGYLLSLP
jgi:hypothetical protein